MKQWVLREGIPEKINKELEQWPELVRRLLFYRGIKTKKEAGKFFNPDYEKDLHDPFEILNMEKAAGRILKAIKENERIIIFGDYDADGVCASAIFHDFFKKIGFENFHVHIPDRHLDGYGLTVEAIKEFAEQKAGLLITLDCGITDYEEVEKANSFGIDVIITDHHLVPKKLPNAFAIIDSKQKKDDYFFKDLCGAGVAFKTVHALIKKGGFNIVYGWEKWLLDAVAIATIADMVPLVGENRVLAHYGLQVLKKTQRMGLVSLCKRLGIALLNVTEDDIAFMIGPRINTASRMDHATASFTLLTTQSGGEASWISARLEALNVDRKAMVEKILSGIEEKIFAYLSAQAGGAKLPEVIVCGDFNWHPGVLGIAANRLIDKYGRPIFLWGKAEAKEIKGSCRSDGSINLVELMRKTAKGFFSDFGGHALAGGFSLAEEKMPDLEKEILKAWKKVSKEKTENNTIFIDKEISIDDISWDFYSMIEKFQPFGIDNQKPVFLFLDLEVAGVKKFGNGGIHLQLDFKKNNGDAVPAIGFFFNGNLADVKKGSRVDLAASLEKSFFKSKPELRLRIIDIKLKS